MEAIHKNDECVALYLPVDYFIQGEILKSSSFHIFEEKYPKNEEIQIVLNPT